MRDKEKKYTREYAIRNLWTTEKLASALIYCKEEEEWDYTYDDEPYVCGYNDVYFTSDGEGYYDYEDALEHEIEWLRQEVSDDK